MSDELEIKIKLKDHAPTALDWFRGMKLKREILRKMELYIRYSNSLSSRLVNAVCISSVQLA